MSLNNVLPWWAYEAQYEGIIAEYNLSELWRYYYGLRWAIYG